MKLKHHNPIQCVVKQAILCNFLITLSLALGFSQTKVEFHPVDYRVEEVPLLKESISSDSPKLTYLSNGFTLNKGDKLNIEIESDKGTKVKFYKKIKEDLKSLIKDDLIKFRFKKFHSRIEITAKRDTVLNMWNLFSPSIPHIILKKSKPSNKISITFTKIENGEDKKLMTCQIPITDYSLQLHHKPMLLSKSTDIVIFTLESRNKQLDGYFDVGDTIKIDIGTDKFTDISSNDYNAIFQDENHIIIPIDKRRDLSNISIPIKGSYTGSIEAHFPTKIELLTPAWSYNVSNENDEKISIGALKHEIILPSISVSGRRIVSDAFINIKNGGYKILNTGDTIVLTIQSKYSNTIQFIEPELYQFSHGKISNSNDDEISFELTSDLNPGESMNIFSLRILTDNQQSNTPIGIAESIQMNLNSLQGAPKVILSNAIMNPNPQSLSYQYYDQISFKMDEKSHVKILNEFENDSNKNIQFSHDSDRYKNSNKVIDLFSVPRSNLDLQLEGFDVGDSFELLTLNNNKGMIENVTLNEIELTDVDIIWDRPNLRILNRIDGPHKIHFNIKDEYKALNVGDNIIIEIDKENSLVFSDTLNQNSSDKKSLFFSIDENNLLNGGYFYVSGAINTNGIVDFSFIVKTKNWEKKLQKKKIRVGHPKVSISKSQSIIVNRLTNPLPLIEIESNEFLRESDSIMISLYPLNYNYPIKISEKHLDNFTNQLRLPLNEDWHSSEYILKAEKITSSAINSAQIKIYLLSESGFDEIIFSEDSALILVNPNISIKNPLGFNYWVGNDSTTEPDGVNISIDAIENKANLYEKAFTLSINIPTHAGCRWKSKEKGDTNYQIVNTGQSLVFSLDPEKITSLQKLGKITELGFFNLVRSEIGQREPFNFIYQLTETEYIELDKKYQFHNPEIKFIKHIESAIQDADLTLREDIYVPITSTYKIKLDELSLIDNGTNPLFENGDTCFISFDSNGYSLKNFGKNPVGINLIEGDKHFTFVITKNNINSFTFKGLVIQYHGEKKTHGSVAQLILNINKGYSEKSNHELYFKQKIHHTELNITIEPNEIVWSRDQHITPEISIQGAVINPEHNIILKMKSNSDKDNAIEWQSKNSLLDNKIMIKDVYKDSLVLSVLSTNNSDAFIIPKWKIINLESPESIVTVEISIDGGQNYQEPKILIKNASLNEVYVKSLKKIFAVEKYQSIGKVVIKGHGAFSSISKGDILQIILTSEKAPITGLSNEQLESLSLSPLLQNAKSLQINPKTIQYSFKFKKPLDPYSVLEIDGLKIKPENMGENSNIHIDYAIRKTSDQKSHTERIVPIRDSLYIYGIQLLAEKQKIYNLSNNKVQYNLPKLKILDDTNKPLIKPHDILRITLDDPNKRIKFTKPDFDFKKINKYFDISYEPHIITIKFEKILNDSIIIPLSVYSPEDKKPMGLMDIKGEFLLKTGERIDFTWPTKIAFSNGVPSYRLSKDTDFLINAGKQDFPDIYLLEDSLQANLEEGDRLSLILPYGFNAQWDKTKKSILTTDILNRNVSYSPMGDTVFIRIEKKSKLNQTFQISGLRLDHIKGEITEGYSPIAIFLDNQKDKPPPLKLMAETGRIRTGSVNILLGSGQYITADDQVLANLELEFKQIAHPLEYIDELWLELENLDLTTQTATKWKNGDKYAHEMNDTRYSVFDTPKGQKQLILKLNLDHEEIDDDGIRIEGLQFDPPRESRGTSFSYGINLLYKENTDSVLSKSYNSITVEFDKKTSCFCPELETLILGIDGLKPNDEAYDIKITHIKTDPLSNKIPAENLLVTDQNDSENKIYFWNTKNAFFKPKKPITIYVKAQINTHRQVLSPYLQVFCDGCESKHYTRRHIEIQSNGSLNRIIRENTKQKSPNFERVKLEKDMTNFNGYIEFSISLNLREGQCVEHVKRYNQTKTELEANIGSSSKSSGSVLDWEKEINLITQKKDNCNDPPLNQKSKEIYYLLALSHYTSYDGSKQVACEKYEKASPPGTQKRSDFRQLPECEPSGHEKLVAEFISIMNLHREEIDNYFSSKSNVFEEKFMTSLEKGQLLLLELQTIYMTLGQRNVLNRHESFHTNVVDHSLLLQDTKELEETYILEKEREFKPKLPKQVRKNQKYKEWRNSRLAKYIDLHDSKSDTNNNIGKYNFTSRTKLSLDDGLVKIRFQNKMAGAKTKISPEIFNEAPYKNLHESRVTDFSEDNMIEFPNSGIYRIDLDIEKERKKSHFQAIISSGLIFLLVFI